MSESKNAGAIKPVFLTRGQYDAALPLTAAQYDAYQRATRSWSIQGVEIRFASYADRGSFENIIWARSSQRLVELNG